MLTHLFESLPDAVLSVDTAWICTYSNPQATTLLALPEAGAVGRSLWDLLPVAQNPSVRDECMQAMQQRAARTFEFPVPALHVWLEARVTPQPQGLSVILRDVTARRRDDDQRQQLLNATHALSSGVSEAEVIETALEIGAGAMGAYAGVVMRLRPDRVSIDLIGSRGYSQDLLNRWATLPMHDVLPVTDAVRSNTPLFLDLRALTEQYPLLGAARSARTCAAAVLPLAAQGDVVGALALSFDHDRIWTPGDHTFLTSLSAQLALALERARSHDAEVRRAEQLTFLARASELLTATHAPKEVLEQIVHLVVPRLSDWCSLQLPLPSGEFEQAALAHVDPAKLEAVRKYEARLPARWDDDRGAGKVFQTQRPLLMPVLRDEDLLAGASSPEELAMLRAAELRSVIVVPLVAGSRSLGVLTLVSATPGRYGDSDLAFAQELAGRAASALENARLAAHLQQERAQLVAILDQLPVAVWVAEVPSGRMIAGNRAIEQVTGRAYHPLESVADYATPEWPLARTLLSGEVVENELRELTDSSGEARFVHLSSAPILDERGTAFLAVATGVDVTERVQAEQAAQAFNVTLEARVQERTAQLEQLNAELDAFSYSVSHDLRTPVRHLQSFAGLLRRALESGRDGAKYLEMIERAAARMSTMIDDLLAFSKSSQQQLQIVTVDLTALLNEVRLDLAADLPGRQIQWQIGPLPTVRADPGLLRQVLVNLLGNAVKYTRPNDHASIHIWAEEDQTETVIHVEDNGIGFEPASAQKLFGVFQRLHHASEFEGNGIGLANVKGIVTRHGGRVWATSSPGKGATFSFSLPVAE
ncbi:ATP-binding protein (plasmid) [Deinococcus sp. KNUC1210]|uniref:ATP-binding protein n=1 Tax=Deinococcus sp. KNUC1210 TaxID=2917691 RepID=UPI001EF0A560|nr:ATP-binding protein [Deinococcus sp. KNUC1210]ULH13904.1 ATP-binding protein [Deinococcus sp. KNUC1210]